MTDVHFGLFSALLHPNIPKNQNLIKNEKNLHMCTKNYDQMMYGS